MGELIEDEEMLEAYYRSCPEEWDEWSRFVIRLRYKEREEMRGS